MMGGLNEFNTAVRVGLDLIVIVCNDGAYGAEHIKLKDKGLEAKATEFEWPNFAQVAETLGGEGVTVSDLNGLEGLGPVIEARTKPLLIELRLDPNAVPRMRK